MYNTSKPQHLQLMEAVIEGSGAASCSLNRYFQNGCKSEGIRWPWEYDHYYEIHWRRIQEYVLRLDKKEREVGDSWRTLKQRNEQRRSESPDRLLKILTRNRHQRTRVHTVFFVPFRFPFPNLLHVPVFSSCFLLSTANLLLKFTTSLRSLLWAAAKAKAASKPPPQGARHTPNAHK